MPILKIMHNFPIKVLSLIFILLIMSTIVFKQHYIGVTYLVNLMLIVSYVFLVFTRRDPYIKFNNIIYAYALFALFIFTSSFWALDFRLSALKGMQVFLILINIIIIYNIVEKFKLYNAFTNGILLGSFVNFILMLNIIDAPFPIIHEGRAMGTLGNANSLAMFMTMSILVSIVYLYKEKEKETSQLFFYYQYINIFLSLYMIILTASKKGILVGSVIIFIFLLLSIKDLKSFAKLTIMSMIIIAISLNFINLDELQNNFTLIVQRFTNFSTQLESSSRFGSTGERLRLIEVGLKYFMDRPLVGHGIANFSVYEGTYSHNNYVELLFGVGLIGTILYYSIYFFIFKKIFNIQNTNLKIILTIVIINMLVVDIAMVSYGDKVTIYMLLFFAIVAEKNVINNFKTGIVHAEKN